MSNPMDFTDDQLERYARHIILKEVGGAGQQRLLAAKVLIIGAGGLGAPAALYLAAAGVGTIGIIDHDIVDLTNLQRQIIHDTPSIGRPKVDSAKDRLAALNPDVTVHAINDKLTLENADSLFQGYDIIIDGSDTFQTRHLVSDTCVRGKKTLVSAALGPFEGQLATFKPHMGKPGSETALPCYRCFMPSAPKGRTETCSDRGILGAVAGVLGSMQALEVLKEITGVGDGLAGKMMIYDALSARIRVIALPADPNCIACGPKPETSTNIPFSDLGIS